MVPLQPLQATSWPVPSSSEPVERASRLTTSVPRDCSTTSPSHGETARSAGCCRRSGYSVIRPLFLPVYVRGGVSEKVGLRGESR